MAKDEEVVDEVEEKEGGVQRRRRWRVPREASKRATESRLTSQTDGETDSPEPGGGKGGGSVERDREGFEKE